jgi:hypothetical protein
MIMTRNRSVVLDSPLIEAVRGVRRQVVHCQEVR